MNVITDSFPTKIRVNGIAYNIKADFRNCAKIIMAFEDDELTIDEKYGILLSRLYETIPDNTIEAIEKGIKFLDCGEETSEDPTGTKRVYKFTKDAKYIYSGIHQTHGIDLEAVGFLHWWKFVFYFMDLSEGCTFNTIVYYRQRKNDGKLTKEEQKTYIKSRAIFDLEYSDELSPAEERFMTLLKGG